MHPWESVSKIRPITASLPELVHGVVQKEKKSKEETSLPLGIQCRGAQNAQASPCSVMAAKKKISCYEDTRWSLIRQQLEYFGTKLGIQVQVNQKHPNKLDHVMKFIY